MCKQKTKKKNYKEFSHSTYIGTAEKNLKKKSKNVPEILL